MMVDGQKHMGTLQKKTSYVLILEVERIEPHKDRLVVKK